MAWHVPADGLSVLPLWSDVVHKLGENGESLDSAFPNCRFLIDSLGGSWTCRHA